MSVVSLVSSGPLLLAIPVAAAAGAVTFLSPVLPAACPRLPGVHHRDVGRGRDGRTRGAAAGAQRGRRRHGERRGRRGR